MTERERLIQLLQSSHCVELWNHNTDDFIEPNPIEKLADHLLANGVIVPPCEVGDTVYFPAETDCECEPYVDVGTVFAIGIDERHTLWISVRYESGLKYYHTSDDFGKTVFLTREEAEKALERSRG